MDKIKKHDVAGTKTMQNHHDDDVESIDEDGMDRGTMVNVGPSASKNFNTNSKLIGQTADVGTIELAGVGFENKGDAFEDFRNDVKKKIASFEEGKEGQDAESEFNSTESIGLKQLATRYADTCDYVYLGLATFCSIGFGAGMPGMCVLFGDMVDGVADTANEGFDAYKESALQMFILGCVMFFISWFNVSLWNIFAARISHKIRLIYFSKCL